MLKVVQKMHRVLPILVGVFSVPLAILMGGGLATAADNASIDTTVNIKPSLTLNIPTNTILMNLDPSTHDFDEQDLTIKVGTNNFTGFKLYVTTPNNATDLVNVADSSKTIENLTTSTAVSSFPVNKWGYRLTQDSTTSSGNYGVFTPSSNTPVMQSSGPINEKVATMGFGAKIDYMKPSGLYQLNLNFKVIPNTTTEYMQNMDPTVCTTDPTVVIDQRDERSYLVQRLDDGKCWMLDNLNLDLTNTDVINALSSTNTNASTTTLGYLKNGGGTTSDQWAITGLSGSNWTTSYSYSQPLANKSGTCSTSNTFPCTYDGNYTNNDVQSSLTPNQSTFGEGTGRIGIYYNYCAATAGSYCYGDGTTEGTGSGDATEDICPAGWRIPTGGPNGEIQSLYDHIAANYTGSGSVDTATDPKSFQYKLSMPLTGNYLDLYPSQTATWRQGTTGYIWASNMSTPDRMNGLHATDSAVTPQGTLSRRGGNPVRCIFKDDTRTAANITTMQEMNHDIVNNTPLNYSGSLADSRDNQSYTIAKINGNIWMTKNLAIGCNGNSVSSKTLTSTNSNVATNWATPTALLTTAANSSATSGFTTAAIACNSTNGGYYNYKAATAGTISGATNSTDAVYDICPSGWRLPTSIERDSLFGHTSEFNVTTAGFYQSGSISNSTQGYWWTSTSKSDTGREGLRSNATTGALEATTNSLRWAGNSVRCIAK